jgi:hypothetical protein
MLAKVNVRLLHGRTFQVFPRQSVINLGIVIANLSDKLSVAFRRNCRHFLQTYQPCLNTSVLALVRRSCPAKGQHQRQRQHSGSHAVSHMFLLRIGYCSQID